MLNFFKPYYPHYSILSILFLFGSHKIQSQEIYYSSITNLPGNALETVIGTFDILSCNKTELFVDTSFVSLEWIDIALCPDGNLYALSHDGIYFIDLIVNSYVKILDEPPYPRWEKGLFCTKDTMLIFGETDILGYDINTGNLTHFGRLPNSIGLFSNIFIYKNMIMGSAHNNKIILIDTLNPASSTIYCSIQSSGLISLFEVSVSCDSVAVFALFANGELFLFDPVTFSLTFYCDVLTNPNEVLQGSHPDFMFMEPEPCQIKIDLDYFDETLPGLDYADTVYCELPANYLLSPIELFTDKQWDSLNIWIENGPAQIFLEGNSSAFAILAGSGSNRLKYTAVGNSDVSQLSTLLSDMFLNGTMPPGITSLKIGYATWADNLESDTAYAYITLIGRTHSAGASGAKSICKHETPLSLSSLISSDASLNGTWLPYTTSDGLFNPMHDLPGTYYYIIDDPFCGKDSAEFDISIYPLPEYELQTIHYTCPGDTVILDLTIENASVMWSDGSTGSSIQIFEPDTIGVTVMDEFGCSYFDTAHVLPKNDCILEKIYIPNIFTPDGNGFNDNWNIQSNTAISSMEVTIFDRWGNALYYEKAPSINWNGTSFSNQFLPPGVYVYSIWFESINHIRINKAGDVTIMR